MNYNFSMRVSLFPAIHSNTMIHVHFSQQSATTTGQRKYTALETKVLTSIGDQRREPNTPNIIRSQAVARQYCVNSCSGIYGYISHLQVLVPSATRTSSRMSLRGYISSSKLDVQASHVFETQDSAPFEARCVRLLDDRSEIAARSSFTTLLNLRAPYCLFMGKRVLLHHYSS